MRPRLRPRLPATLAIAFALIWVAGAGPTAAASTEGGASGGSPSGSAPPRVVSLNPSLTAILLDLGAGPSLVGVDDWSARDLPAVAHLPQVGGLFNPSVEGILALAPDVVVWVPSAQQRSLRERLEALGVDVLELPNITLPEVLASIEQLGRRVGRGDAARERVAAIRLAWQRAREEAGQRAQPRAVMVLQRDPLYVVGRGSFLDAMMDAAGTRNLAAAFDEPYPRVGVEWLIAAGPELILDAAPDPEGAAGHWSRWPSLVDGATRGVVQVPPDLVTLPGPELDRAVQWLSEAVARSLAAAPEVGAGAAQAPAGP